MSRFIHGAGLLVDFGVIYLGIYVLQRESSMSTSLILGASDKPERYANKAMHQLLNHGHQVVLVNPKGGTIDGLTVHAAISDVLTPVDTVTVYVNPDILNLHLESIARLNPRRVIFNPGTESSSAAEFLRAKNIEVEEACTLVLLSLGSY